MQVHKCQWFRAKECSAHLLPAECAFYSSVHFISQCTLIGLLPTVQPRKSAASKGPTSNLYAAGMIELSFMGQECHIGLVRDREAPLTSRLKSHITQLNYSLL